MVDLKGKQILNFERVGMENNGKQINDFLRASLETKVSPFATVVFHLPFNYKASDDLISCLALLFCL